jgi:IclR family acetate operon transcriptional repressor
MPDVPVKAVKKALDLLSILVFDDPELRGVKLTDLAQRLGLPSNTTHNLLKTMSACGYVAQNESGRYRPGPQCRRIGLINRVEGGDFKQKLADVLKRYTAQINESMVFAALHGGKRVVLARSEPVSQVIRIDHQTVESRNIYRLPTGRILTAFASPAEYRRIQDNYGEPGENWPDYETDIKRIRKEERCLMLPDTNGINSFSLPVRNKDGRLLGAIGCHAPAFRSGAAVQKKILNALLLAADELSVK